MKIILNGQINHLNFKNRESIHSTRTINATNSTINKLTSKCIFFQRMQIILITYYIVLQNSQMQ
jgi:transposase-like protein